MLFRITARKNGGVARRYYSGERLTEGAPVEFYGNLDLAFGYPLTWNDAPRLFEGRNPTTNEPLVRRRGGNHKSGWDMTFVAPKTVSILWGLAPDDIREEIVDAHVAAVKEALDAFLPKAALVPRNVGEFLTGSFIFNHGMTRMLDPHLHSHVFLLNMAYATGVVKGESDFEGTISHPAFRALTLNYKWAKVAKDLYIASLAWRLATKGFPIARRGNIFEIPGLRSLEKEFSTAGEIFRVKGMTPEDWARYKKDKDLSKSFGRLGTKWLSRALGTGFDVNEFFSGIKPSTNQAGNGATTVSPGRIAPESIDLWKIRYVARIWTLVARNLMGIANLEEIKKISERLENEYRDKVIPYNRSHGPTAARDSVKEISS